MEQSGRVNGKIFGLAGTLHHILSVGIFSLLFTGIKTDIKHLLSIGHPQDEILMARCPAQ